MKAVILAAGKGTRMAEMGLVHKSLAAINNKPVINYSLDLVTGGKRGSLVSEIILVVGHEAESIMNYVGTDYKDVPVRYVMQKEQLGIAHAVKTAGPVVDDDFIMCLSDEILVDSSMEAMVQFFNTHGADCVCGAIDDAVDFRMKAIALDVDSDMNLVGIVEKPQAYFNQYRGIGECIFSRKMLALLETLKPNEKRGEYEMGDWIRTGLEAGYLCKVFELAKGYLNINTVEDFRIANGAASNFPSMGSLRKADDRMAKEEQAQAMMSQ